MIKIIIYNIVDVLLSLIYQLHQVVWLYYFDIAITSIKFSNLFNLYCDVAIYNVTDIIRKNYCILHCRTRSN